MVRSRKQPSPVKRSTYAADQARAMGVRAARLATSAQAAPVGPWALSEFLDAVEKDSVERVTFDDAGKALVAVDADTVNRTALPCCVACSASCPNQHDQIDDDHEHRTEMLETSSTP